MNVMSSLFFVTDWLPTLFGAAGGSDEEVLHLHGVNHFEAMASNDEDEDEDVDYPRDEVFFHSAVGKGILR